MGHHISSQIKHHVDNLDDFDKDRVNSIHHGNISFVVNKKNLYYRELSIQDHLKKNGLPPKPAQGLSVIDQILITIANGRGFNDVENGSIIFYIRNWKIYKQEIHISDLESFDTKGDTRGKVHHNSR